MRADDDVPAPPRARGQLRPGDLFASYRVERAIGRGAMGEVYEVEHLGLGRRFALKVLRADGDGPSGARLAREARAAASVRHEHIVDVVDAGEHDGVPYLAMELLEGETLADLIDREGPLTAERVAALLVPVCCAVAAAHARGVVHRDLKPANIFLARSRRDEVVPKVLDFGVCREGALDEAAQRLTGTSALLGTPAYMAPEQVCGARDVGPASDQWALGVVLFECATLRRPFRGDVLFLLFASIMSDPVPPPASINPAVDPALAEVILRALQRDPGRRFPSCRALARALLPLAPEAVRAQWGPELARDDVADDAPAAPAAPSPAAPSAPRPDTLREGVSLSARLARAPRYFSAVPFAVGFAAAAALAAGWSRAHPSAAPPSLARPRAAPPVAAPSLPVASPAVAPPAVAPPAVAPPAVAPPAAVASPPAVAAPRRAVTTRRAPRVTPPPAAAPPRPTAPAPQGEPWQQLRTEFGS